MAKYKYDPECEYCISNGQEQIREKSDLKEKLIQLKSDRQGISDKLEECVRELTELEHSESEKEEYERFTDELNQIQHDAVKIGGTISTKESKLEHLSTEIDNIREKIEQYYEYEEKIKQNSEISAQIDQIQVQAIGLLQDRDVVEAKYEKVSGKLLVVEKEKNDIEETIQNLVEIEQKILDYDLYLTATSRDGIPSELISKTIPAIEAEINEVLDNMMVGFTLKLEVEGKNINTYISYGDEYWNLELSSGMERFVSSLAIRIGLINVSTLPRPNFFVIDEGFGTLDGDNIANMESAFNYLKTQFDFILIISHLDTIKDYMDVLIPIEVAETGSKVRLV